jgi:hypothetical protein
VGISHSYRYASVEIGSPDLKMYLCYFIHIVTEILFGL